MTRKNKGPDFICIGLQKTGTTWLNKNLKKHPDVFLPHAMKEIRYFWEKSYLPDESLWVRFSKKNWFYQRNRKYLMHRPWYYYNQAKIYISNLEKVIKGKQHQSLFKILNFTMQSLIWDYKYILMPHNDKWYKALFNPAGEKICGEFSPIYYLIPEKAIKEISSLLPDVKLLIFLRNPIEYSWSLAKMRLIQLEDNSYDDFIEEAIFRQLDYQYNECPSFKIMIDTWKKYFPVENIYIDYYDNLLTNSNKFFDDVCNFISVDPSAYPKWARDKLAERVHQGIVMDIPDKFAYYLANQYYDAIVEMVPEYSPFASRWLEQCNRLRNMVKVVYTVAGTE